MSEYTVKKRIKFTLLLKTNKTGCVNGVC